MNNNSDPGLPPFAPMEVAGGRPIVGVFCASLHVSHEKGERWVDLTHGNTGPAVLGLADATMQVLTPSQILSRTRRFLHRTERLKPGLKLQGKVCENPLRLLRGQPRGLAR